MADKVAIYITKDQHDWLNRQPRSFSFSAQIRMLLDALMVFDSLEQALEVDFNGIRTETG